MQVQNNALVSQPQSGSTVVATPPAGGGRYVSIFENPAEFGARVQIAQALSKTQFVPEAFRGKAEDCLVALDMAARLELNPLAVFSDIYIIDNRASFSSKFLIALVNRSGRFSRIQYAEGVDGMTEVTFSGWGETRGQRKTWKEKVPNYYAQASFTELASGEVYTSPRVDMNFAEKNGWVQKNGSKWQSMPEIMCRYRAASILIKSVCPEIVMGLEWADDLQDAKEDKPAARPVDVKPAPRKSVPQIKNDVVIEVVDDSAFQNFGAQINAAPSVAALNQIAAAIAEANLTAAQKTTLRRVWTQKKKELAQTSVAPTLPAFENLPSETTINAVALRTAINDATNVGALESMRNAIADALHNGQITDDEADDLQQACATRLDDLTPAEVDDAPTPPTPAQLERATAFLDEIERYTKSDDVAALNFMRATIYNAQIEGTITPAQAQELTQKVVSIVNDLDG